MSSLVSDKKRVFLRRLCCGSRVIVRRMEALLDNAKVASYLSIRIPLHYGLIIFPSATDGHYLRWLLLMAILHFELTLGIGRRCVNNRIYQRAFKLR